MKIFTYTCIIVSIKAEFIKRRLLNALSQLVQHLLHNEWYIIYVRFQTSSLVPFHQLGKKTVISKILPLPKIF